MLAWQRDGVSVTIPSEKQSHRPCTHTHVCIVAVQSPSCIRLSATPWTAVCQASLSLAISQSLPKFMSIASVMPSSHLSLCHLLLPSVSPSIRVFSNELAVRIRWPKYWSFSFNNRYIHLHMYIYTHIHIHVCIIRKCAACGSAWWVNLDWHVYWCVCASVYLSVGEGKMDIMWGRPHMH